MKKLHEKFLEKKNGGYAVLVAGLMSPSFAFAQGLNGVQNNLKQQFLAVWNIGSYLFMAIGIFYVGTGIMRLKAAVDSQGQQVKYGEGIWRIGLGAGFLMIDFLINTTIGTVTNQDGQFKQESLF